MRVFYIKCYSKLCISGCLCCSKRMAEGILIKFQRIVTVSHDTWCDDSFYHVAIDKTIICAYNSENSGSIFELSCAYSICGDFHSS